MVCMPMYLTPWYLTSLSMIPVVIANQLFKNARTRYHTLLR